MKEYYVTDLDFKKVSNDGMCELYYKLDGTRFHFNFNLLEYYAYHIQENEEKLKSMLEVLNEFEHGVVIALTKSIDYYHETMET